MPEHVFTTYVDMMHRRIYADSWLHLTDYRWDRIPPRLLKSYIWRVASFTLDALVLEAYGNSAEAYITHEEAKFLYVFEPSKRVSLSDYPEEWAWWVTAGWNVYLEDGKDGDLWLRAAKDNDRGAGGHLAGKKVRNPAKVREWLRHLLYWNIHPVKAQRYYDQKQGIPESEIEAMVARLTKAHSTPKVKPRSARKKSE